MPPVSMRIYLSNAQSRCRVTRRLRRLVRRAVRATAAEEGYARPFAVSVTFTDNEGIRGFNRAYRHIDAPTDVLSFPLTDPGGDDPAPQPDGPRVSLGDIVISLERAREQGDLYGHGFEREAAFLCVHSMLHLLGYDHETSPAREADMRARQRRILEAMGLGVAEDGAGNGAAGRSEAGGQTKGDRELP